MDRQTRLGRVEPSADLPMNLRRRRIDRTGSRPSRRLATKGYEKRQRGDAVSCRHPHPALDDLLCLSDLREAVVLHPVNEQFLLLHRVFLPGHHPIRCPAPVRPGSPSIHFCSNGARSFLHYWTRFLHRRERQLLPDDVYLLHHWE